MPVQLLANRPDVRQAELNLAQAFYATNAARTAFYPGVTLSGGLLRLAGRSSAANSALRAVSFANAATRSIWIYASR